MSAWTVLVLASAGTLASAGMLSIANACEYVRVLGVREHCECARVLEETLRMRASALGRWREETLRMRASAWKCLLSA